MTTNLSLSESVLAALRDRFSDVELPNHEGESVKLSSLTQPGLMDQCLDFTDGYPLLLI